VLDVDDDNIWRVDLFAILDITEEHSKDDIRQVYKKLAKQYHPDKFPSGSAEQEEARLKFSEISQAYEILSNEQKRQQYLETRRLLAHHLVEPGAESSPDTPAAASSNPAAPSAPPPKHVPREDYKLKEAEEAFKEGLALFRKNELDSAISAFQQAISILPEIGKYHSNLGQAFLSKGWTGMAQASFKKALVLNPNDPIAKKHYEPEKPKKKGFLSGLFGGRKK